jgi:ABC-type glycerol-3-phosphate transport system substrate-binding protein
MTLSRRACLVGMALFASLTWPAAGEAADLSGWAKALRDKHGGAEIRVLAISHPTTDAMRALSPEFETATGMKVTWEVVGSGEIMAKQALAQTARDASYDVYMVRGVSLAEYDAKRMLTDLTPFIKNAQLTPPDYGYEDFHPAYRNGLGVWNDKILGVPIAGETFFISYRKDLFDKYGKSPPQTMDQLLELARFFQNKEPGLYGISMRAETGRTLALSWDLFTPAFGGAILDQKTWDVKINTPETLASLKFILALLGNAPPDIETYTWDAAISAFASGKTAMWFDATALQPWLTDPTKSKVIGKVGYVAPPEGPKGRFAPVGGWSLGVPSNAKNKEAGWAYISWMTAKAKAQELTAKGGVPSRVSLLTAPEFIAQDPSVAKALKESLDAAENLLAIGRRWVPATAEATKIHQVAGYHAGQALLKKMTPEAAVAAAVPELQEISAKIKKTQ